jgi:periplasmic protein CpxP/Spy
MNRNKFYWLIIIALALLNGVLLFLHFNRPDRQSGPRNIIIGRLQLDEQQIKQYDVLVTAHQATSIVNEAKINALKKSLYIQLNHSIDTLKVDSLAKNLAEFQKNAEMLNFKHFEAIKKICKPAQLPLFETLIGELSQLFANKNPHPKK